MLCKRVSCGCGAGICWRRQIAGVSGDSHVIVARRFRAPLLQRPRAFPVRERLDRQVALCNARRLVDQHTARGGLYGRRGIGGVSRRTTHRYSGLARRMARRLRERGVCVAVGDQAAGLPLLTAPYGHGRGIAAQDSLSPDWRVGGYTLSGHAFSGTPVTVSRLRRSEWCSRAGDG